LELFFDPEDSRCPWFNDVQNIVIQIYTEEMEKQQKEKPLIITINEAVEQELILTQWQGYFMGLSQKFITALGIPEKNQRFRAHLPDERAHYSVQTYDHEINLDTWGWTEIAGFAYRTDFDLCQHQEASGQNMEVVREDGTRFIPHVVEPSFGLDRLVYVTMESSYQRKSKRNIFSFPRELAPYQVAVFPLVTKDGVEEKAEEVWDLLRERGFWIIYDTSGSVGRRYARVDEIGIPLAVTVDYRTRDEDILTIRDRDSWKQVSLRVDELPEALESYFNRQKNFQDLGVILEKD
jgi:glycyl-tRNA synthetase